jgi:DNA-binding beta-propeller fold protein YncE
LSGEDKETETMVSALRLVGLFGLAVTTAIATLPLPALADAPRGLLETIHKHITVTSTVTDNGDLNPYAVVVAPVSAGKVQKDDVLVDNFNNLSNLQGTGTTIVDYSPSTHKTFTFAKVPQDLAQCPGGVGLTTAMTMLKSGWVIVGSTPSKDGTTGTKGPGCFLVFDSNGQLATTWSGPNINDPWGDMAVIDRGSIATLFVSMSGFDIPAPQATGDPASVNKQTVMRIDLSIPASGPPTITGQTVIASGLSARADRDVFLIGPTGLALAPDGTTLYVSDAVNNRIIAIPDATTRRDNAALDRTVTKDGLLKRPLALALTPEGHLLVCNAKNGQLVEVDPATGKQLYAQWIDTNPAQSPPGNGDLFGIAMTPDGQGFYYVEDDVNTLMEAVR